MKQAEVEEVSTCLLLLLDNVDYITYPALLTTMIGASIPIEILEKCLKAKKYILEDMRKLNPR